MEDSTTIATETTLASSDVLGVTNVTKKDEAIVQKDNIVDLIAEEVANKKEKEDEKQMDVEENKKKVDEEEKEEDDDLDTSVQKIIVRFQDPSLSRTTFDDNGEEVLINTYADFKYMKIHTYMLEKEENKDALKCLYTFHIGKAFSVDNMKYIFLFASLPVQDGNKSIAYVSYILLKLL
jgi:hypothetical protein